MENNPIILSKIVETVEPHECDVAKHDMCANYKGICFVGKCPISGILYPVNSYKVNVTLNGSVSDKKLLNIKYYCKKCKTPYFLDEENKNDEYCSSCVKLGYSKSN